MPQTPLTSTTPYATAADLAVYCDLDEVADMLRDKDAPRPVTAALTNASTPLGGKLNRLLLAATGEIEGQVLVGKRFSPADLAALTGSAKENLIRLTCNLCFWRLCQRRKPLTADPKKVPGAAQAEEMLVRLGKGELIFGTVESADAGLDEAVQSRIESPDGVVSPVTERAGALFGSHTRKKGWN